MPAYITPPSMTQAATTQTTAAQVNMGDLSAPMGTTTQEQLKGILNENSALMQNARTQGMQQAASRGLLNSSMGVQAGQQAVLNAATPIATSDANAINSLAQSNVQQTNAANQFNAQQSNAQSQFNASQTNQAALNAMSDNTKLQLADIESNYKNLMQVNSSAGSMYEQYLKNLSDISMSDIEADAKTNAIANQTTYLKSALSTLQNLNNISGLITF